MDAISRRGFLELTGGVVVFALVQACGSKGEDDEKVDTTCDGIGSTSSSSSGHTHFVCVTRADLETPPAAGVTLTSSNYEGHTHTVTLSAAQLTTLGSGGEVTVTSSSSSGHTHSFDIKKVG